MLHGPAALRLDAVALQAQFAALDAVLPPDGRTCFGAAPGTGWTAIPLWTGQRQPALDHLPLVQALLDRPDLEVRRAFILRQPPRGMLAWHFDPCALYLEETRLLIAIHAPPEAVTLIGDESAAYPEGQAWTGDFTFPHQVENPSDRDRIVVAVDVTCTPAVRALFAPELSAEPERRHALAVRAQALWLESRNRVPVPA